MSKISLTLPDGSSLDFQSGVIGSEVLKKLGAGLAKDAIAIKIDDHAIIDLMTPIEKNCQIKVLTEKDSESLEVLRHSTAHIMSEAVQSLFKGVKVTIGPATEQGFYYDYDYDKTFTPEDLAKIENKMSEIIQAKRAFCRTLVPKKEAREKFKKMHEDYKIEILEGIPDEKVSLYQQGEWVDLCRGPHVPHTGWVRAFKLLSVAGAYWRGDEKNKMLQRIYGTSFFSKKDLESHVHQLEEAQKRDHRKLGRELDLFSFHEESPASPFFHPKGQKVYELLVDFWKKEHTNAGYQIVKTPFILSDELWRRSGHYEHYKENMYFVKIDEKDFAVKPMNCPGHILIYNTQKHSYRDLPLRMAEIGQVHRHERSGVTHGLLRVRTFSIDDAHIFCAEEQIEEEVARVIHLLISVYQKFGFQEFKIELSTRPKDSIGSEEIWNKATSGLQNALTHLKLSYQLNPGEGAFYGPKIDFHVKDSIGRTWQCGTVQLDFSMPERFHLNYVGADSKEHRPVMIHRAIFGSVERFLGILIEHYAGAFPVWLAPVQVIILNVTDNQKEYAQKVYEKLHEAQVRVALDSRNEKLGFKIREAQLQKIPYMGVIGDKEVQSQTLSIRQRSGESLSPMTVDQFITAVKAQEVNYR